MIQLLAAQMRERREAAARETRRLVDPGREGRQPAEGSDDGPGCPGAKGADVVDMDEEDLEEEGDPPANELLGDDSELGSDDGDGEGGEGEEEEEQEEEEEEEEGDDQKKGGIEVMSTAGAAAGGPVLQLPSNDGWVRSRKGGLHICTGDALPGMGEGVFCPNPGKHKLIACGNEIRDKPKFFEEYPQALKNFACRTCQRNY